jgi:hypothetical protein
MKVGRIRVLVTAALAVFETILLGCSQVPSLLVRPAPSGNLGQSSQQNYKRIADCTRSKEKREQDLDRDTGPAKTGRQGCFDSGNETCQFFIGFHVGHPC